MMVTGKCLAEFVSKTLQKAPLTRDIYSFIFNEI